VRKWILLHGARIANEPEWTVQVVQVDVQRLLGRQRASRSVVYSPKVLMSIIN